jgi:hypothetical protein
MRKALVLLLRTIRVFALSAGSASPQAAAEQIPHFRAKSVAPRIFRCAPVRDDTSMGILNSIPPSPEPDDVSFRCRTVIAALFFDPDKREAEPRWLSICDGPSTRSMLCAVMLAPAEAQAPQGQNY